VLSVTRCIAHWPIKRRHQCRYVRIFESWRCTRAARRVVKQHKQITVRRREVAAVAAAAHLSTAIKLLTIAPTATTAVRLWSVQFSSVLNPSIIRRGGWSRALAGPVGVTLKCLPHEKSARGEIITNLICLPLWKFRRSSKMSPYYRIAPPFQKTFSRSTIYR